MECCKSWTALILDFLWSLLILLATSIYRTWIFTIFLSVSIGPSVVVSRLYEFFGGQGPPPLIVEPALGLILLSYWAEVSVHAESRFCGKIVDKLKLRFPNTMSFGRFCVHFLFYIVAYIGMHVCFIRSHTIPFPEAYDQEHYVHSKHAPLTLPKKVREEREAAAISSQETLTVLFLMCLAYLVFITARNFHKDLMHLTRNLPPASFSALNNCLMRMGFCILHLMVNTLYFLPCLAMAYTSTRYKTDASTAYFQLTFSSALTGIVAAMLELNKPWPQQRGSMPCLSLEVKNNVFGKTLLCRILILPILLAYYQPFDHPKVLEYEFDSGNHDVFWFNVSACFAVLHVVKLGTHAVLSLAQEIEMDRWQPRENVVHFPAPEAGASANAGVNVVPPCASNTCNEDTEANTCPRGSANLLNNNNSYQPQHLNPNGNSEKLDGQDTPDVSTNDAVELGVETGTHKDLVIHTEVLIEENNEKEIEGERSDMEESHPVEISANGNSNFQVETQ